MAENGTNGNGGSVPNRVIAWACAIFFAGAAVVAPLYARIGSNEEHVREVLDLRSRVSEAVQEALKAKIEGQDLVLQREMRLLNDATAARIAGVEALAQKERDWIKDRLEKIIAELYRTRDAVFREDDR